jgi:hypothetical protein
MAGVASNNRIGSDRFSIGNEYTGRMDQTTALFVSIGAEAVAAATLLALSGWGKPWRGMAAAALATLITHPLAWRAAPGLDPVMGFWARTVVVETLVSLAETAAYRWLVPLAWPRALLASIAANAASTCVGLAYFYSVGLL